LQAHRRGGRVGGADQPAHPPTGHGVGLGHAVEHQAAIGQFGHHHRHGAELVVVVGQVLVDLVGDHPHIVVGGPTADGIHTVSGVHGTGGVGRRHEHQRFGAVGAGRLELLHGHHEPVIGGGGHLHAHPASQGDGLGIGGPVGRGQKHLVAGIEQHGEAVVHRVLAPVGHHHLRRLHLQARIPPGLGRNGLLQLGQAPGRGIAVITRVVHRRSGCVQDGRRGGEIGLACAKADHRSPLGLQGLGLGVHRQGG